jgi:hypothetical protein
MKVYWQQLRRDSVLSSALTTVSNKRRSEAFGRPKGGFDAFVKTFGYDPGRAERGILTLEEAKAFVESFRPWEIDEGAQELTVELEVRPQEE